MFKLKMQIAESVYASLRNPGDRKRWLRAEVSELGIKYSGLDDIPLDAIFPLTALYTNGQLDGNKILELTEIDSSKFSDFIDLLSQYALIDECPYSAKYQLTDKGISACAEIFKNVITRKRLELKRELESLEIIYCKLEEL
jgi:hypothetical protein